MPSHDPVSSTPASPAPGARCPRCGTPLPPDAPAGLCPACLVSAHFGSQADESDAGSARPQAPAIEGIAPHFPALDILSCLGRGGMGVVYRARQKSLGRDVALKLLAPERSGDPAFAARFAREAQALARLDHPHIVTIHDFGQAGGFFYLLMEFVDGVTLRHLLDGSRIAPREALAIVPQICDALQYAHDQGIVHRDIKPENILLDRRGRVKVADFGLAKLVGPLGEPAEGEMKGTPAGIPAAAQPAPTPSLTEAGKIMGTPRYMAPEQRDRPAEVDHRADIYALGVVFFQMLTGELPDEKLLRPPSARVAGLRIDVRLDEIVLRAMEREPSRRYATASALKTEVETLAAADEPQPPRPGADATWWWKRHFAGFDYRSRTTFFGLPLWSIAAGHDPATGRKRVAHGIIAIGDVARGVVAIGGIATGGLAFGGIALGVLSWGGLAAGLMASGGLGVGLVGAMGGLAVAPIAVGAIGLGWYVLAAQGFGHSVYDITHHDPAASAFFSAWADAMLKRIPLVSALVYLIGLSVAIGVPLFVRNRLRHADAELRNGEPGTSPPARPTSLTSRILTGGGLFTVVFALVGVLVMAGLIIAGKFDIPGVTPAVHISATSDGRPSSSGAVEAPASRAAGMAAPTAVVQLVPDYEKEFRWRWRVTRDHPARICFAIEDSSADGATGPIYPMSLESNAPARGEPDPGEDILLTVIKEGDRTSLRIENHPTGHPEYPQQLTQIVPLESWRQVVAPTKPTSLTTDRYQTIWEADIVRHSADGTITSPRHLRLVARLASPGEPDVAQMLGDDDPVRVILPLP